MMRLAVAIAIAYFVLWGSLVPEFSMVGDDAYHHGELAEVFEEGSLASQLRAVLVEAQGGGHFKPTQDVICIFAHKGFGPWGWAPAVLTLLTALHAVSALLVAGLAMRMGASRFFAQCAGLVAFLHPVADESLSQMLFGPNVLGMFFLLLALHAWWWVERDGRWQVRPLRLALGGFCVLAAMGSNVNFLMTAPVVLGCVQLARWPRAASTSARVWPALILVLATGATALHRHLAYGAVTTKMSTYTRILDGSEANEPNLATELFEHLVLMRPTHGVEQLAGPLGPSWDAAESAATGHAIPKRPLLALGLALVLWLLIAVRPRRDVEGSRLSPSLLTGGLMLIAGLVPYAVFLNTLAMNRYLYVALAGLGLVAGGSLGWMAQRGRWGRPIALALLGALLVIFCLQSFATRESILYAHRSTPRLTARMAARITTDVTNVQVIAFPRGVPRAGYQFLAPEHLHILLVAASGQSFAMNYEGWLAGWFAGRAMDPRAPESRLFMFDSRASVRLLDAAPDPRFAGSLRGLLADDLIMRRRRAWSQGLAAERPIEIGYWAEGLGRAGPTGERMVSGAFNGLSRGRILPARDAAKPVDARRSAAAALMGAVPTLAKTQPPRVLWSYLRNARAELADFPGLEERLVRALSPPTKPRDRRALALLAEDAKSAAASAAALKLLAPDAALRALVASWRALRGRAAISKSAAERARVARGLHAWWKERGVPRPERWADFLRARWQGYRAGDRTGQAPSLGALGAEEQELLAGADPQAVAAGVQAELLFADTLGFRGDGKFADIALVVGGSARHLSGGAAPWCTRVALAWRRPEDASVEARWERAIPHPGIPAGKWRLMTAAVPRPVGGGTFMVTLEVLVGGKTVFSSAPLPVVLPD